MRVLITTPSAWGHLQPMMPLVKALQRQGHEVRWATGPDGCGWVNAAGVQAVAAGVEQQALLAAVANLPADLRGLPRAAIPDIMFGRIFGGLAAPAMLRDLSPIVADWPPDLVVHDAAEFAGPIIAAKIGAPTVTKSYGMLLPRQRVVAAADHAAELWRSVDLEPPPFGGCYQQLYLDICPTALQPMLPSYIPRRQLLRPISHDSIASESGPPAVDWPTAFPAVYLTLGTVFKSTALLRGAVNALADLGVSILVTVGSGMDPTELGPQPRHVRVEGYVPQSLVMSRCRVVVSHGGSGTAFAALSHGVPQLCLPQGADQFLNANAIARAGAGLQLITEVVDGGAIANAVGRLLNEPSFRSATGAIAAEISQMPHPDHVASALDQLAR